MFDEASLCLPNPTILNHIHKQEGAVPALLCVDGRAGAAHGPGRRRQDGLLPITPVRMSRRIVRYILTHVLALRRRVSPMYTRTYTPLKQPRRRASALRGGAGPRR